MSIRLGTRGAVLRRRHSAALGSSPHTSTHVSHSAGVSVVVPIVPSRPANFASKETEHDGEHSSADRLHRLARSRHPGPARWAAAGRAGFRNDLSSDGVQQIAAILAADQLGNLSSISIVSHGETGELELGSSLITDSNLAGHASALAAIGAALAPGGTIQLYGCDVAQGPAGQQFINDFSSLTGGARVEASTQIVGSAALGGTWTLDASSDGTTPTDRAARRWFRRRADRLQRSGAEPGPARAFDPACRCRGDCAVHRDCTCRFPGSTRRRADRPAVLQDQPGQRRPARRHQQYGRLGDAPVDLFRWGNTAGTPQNVSVHNGNETSVAVDTAAGLVFGIGIGNNGSYDAVSVHNLKTGALIETIEFGPNTGSASTDDVVQALALDPLTNTLYVGDWGSGLGTTGVAEFTYDPSTGLLTPFTTGTSATSITTTIAGGSSTTSTANGVLSFHREPQVWGTRTQTRSTSIAPTTSSITSTTTAATTSAHSARPTRSTSSTPMGRRSRRPS